MILDAHSRKVVGWALDRTLRARLPLTALEQAILNREPPPGVVHHSDRGIQYASDDYLRMLRDHGMTPRMSRPGNPFDNATCESFFKTLKREEIYANDYDDLEHLLETVGTFIERYSIGAVYTRRWATNHPTSSKRGSELMMATGVS